MAGFADELSLKLTAKDEMSARLRDVQKELTAVTRKMAVASKELKDTGSPEAAAELKSLEAEFRRLAKVQQDAAAASKRAREELKRVHAEAGRATTAMGRLGQSITKHATAIRNAGLIAGAALVLFAKQSIQAFAEAEKSTIMLQQAYARFPKLNDVTLASFDALNTSLMNLSGTDDDLLASAEALLARFDLTGRQIQEVIPLVDDYAIATGQDVLTATKKVGMALLGNAKALKSMGINFKATGDRAADYSAIMAILEQKVGGVGEAFGKTTAGQLAIASANFNNLQESVGQALVPALQDVVNVMRPAVAMFTALPEPVKQVGIMFTALGIAAIVATPRLVAFSAALKSINVGILSLGPLAAILIGGAIATKQAYDAGQQLNEGQKSLGQTIEENHGAIGFLAVGWSNVQTVLEKVRGTTKETAHATDMTTVASKKESAAAIEAARTNNANAEALDRVTIFTRHAAGASMTLAAALNRINTILDQADAVKAYKKSIEDYIKKPSVDAAKATVRAFTTAAGAYRDGSKAQADFVKKNLPAVERAIRSSGMDKSLRLKLLVPLQQARLAAIRVQEVIDLMHGKKIAITYTGGTPTNQGGYHRALGGAVFGPGTGTSDSIPAMLSNGEYVIRAAAARAIGYDALDSLNIADRLPTLPPAVNAPQITLPAQSAGRDAPLVGTMIVQPTGQIDLELALAREARRQDRDRRTRHAGTGRR